MTDKFGRQLTYLRVSLIDRCNLKCFYCMPAGPSNPFKESELLDLDETFKIVSLFARLGIRKVRLTGGEPLLRKGVPELVSRIKGLPGIREVVMTTNGVLLGAFAPALKAAGLDRLNVSLDTLDRENFKRVTGYDKLDQVLSGIEAAVRAGIGPVKINAVLMKGVNDGEIFDLLDYAVSRGMELRFIEWMPTAGEIGPIRVDRYLSVDSVKKTIAARYAMTPDSPDPNAPASSYLLSGTSTRVGFISPLSNAFCGKCNRLRLKANGMMKTCLHGKEDLDLRGMLRSGVEESRILRAIESTVFDRPEEHFLNAAGKTHEDFVMTAVGG